MLTVDDIAKLMKCSPKHIRRMADAGRMPRAVKFGSLHRWNRKIIEQWIADGCPNSRTMRKGGGS